MTLRAAQSALERIETELLALLKAGLDYTYLVAAFPEDPARFDMGDRNKVALVQYLGARYGQASGSGEGLQSRSASFRIHILLNQAKGSVRGTAEIEDVRQALQARKIQGSRVEMLKDGLSRNDGPLWEYLVDVALDVPAIPTLHPEPGIFVERFQKEENPDG